MRLLVALLVAVCVVEVVHMKFELWGINQKVGWVKAWLDGKEPGKWPIHIDTKQKTIMVHAVIFGLVLAVCLGIFYGLNLSEKTMVTIGLIALIGNYVYVTWKVDAIHRHIHRVLDVIKDQKK